MAIKLYDKKELNDVAMRGATTFVEQGWEMDDLAELQNNIIELSTKLFEEKSGLDVLKLTATQQVYFVGFIMEVSMYVGMELQRKISDGGTNGVLG